MPLISAGTNNSGLTPGKLLDRATTKVFAKERWGDDWAETPLIALSASAQAFPGRSTCSLQIDTGQVKRPEDADYVFHDEQHDDESLWIDHFVCVVVFPDGDDPATPYAVWCGYLPQQSVDMEGQRGGVDSQGNPVLEYSTSILLTAYGLDFLLERRQIRGAFVRDPDNNAVRILRAPAFNERARGGTAVLGNSSGATVNDPTLPDGSPPINAWVFDGEQVAWNVRRIIDYLLYFSQQTIDEADSPQFELSSDVFMLQFLETIEPILRQERQNIRALLAKLVERRRGLGMVVRWALEDENEMLMPKGVVDLHVYSLARDTVSIGDVTLVQNLTVADLSLGRSIGVKPVVNLDSLATYDEVIVEGERIRSVFTVGGENVPGNIYNRLESVWTVAQQRAYLAADDVQRRSDLHESVFRLFGLPIAFDWKQGATQSNLAPTLDDDGNVDFTTGANQFNAYVKILPSLPLLERADSAAALGEPKFMRPFALMEIPDSDPIAVSRYVFADAKPDEEIGLYSAGRVTPHDRGGLIEVRFSPNHLLGLGVFFNPDGDPFGRCFPVDGSPPTTSTQSSCVQAGGTWDTSILGPCALPDVQATQGDCVTAGGTWSNGICSFADVSETELDCFLLGGTWNGFDPNATPSDVAPVFDYRKMLVTLAVELDQYASVRVETGAPGDYGHKRRLTIHVPDAHVWVAGLHLVDGLNEDGTPHEREGSRILRDDTARLRAIGALAKLWYGKRRRTVDVLEHGVFAPMPIGTMIDTISMEGAQKDVHTVVSEQRWDFENGTTAIATGYSELDLSAL